MRQLIENMIRANLDEVTIDNKNGRGQVPWNQEVDYKGVRVQMKPSTFLKLAAGANITRGGEMVDYIKGGGSIGAPFLQIEVPDDMETQPQVVGHEGRHRMAAIMEVEGDKPIEVHIFPRGAIRRGKQINKDVLNYFNNGMYKENTTTLIRGPLWK